ncbi:hypothetical protein V8C34DRAFT_198001 [Trichoderma compactum]
MPFSHAGSFSSSTRASGTYGSIVLRVSVIALELGHEPPRLCRGYPMEYDGHGLSHVWPGPASQISTQHARRVTSKCCASEYLLRSELFHPCKIGEKSISSQATRLAAVAYSHVLCQPSKSLSGTKWCVPMLRIGPTLDLALTGSRLSCSNASTSIVQETGPLVAAHGHPSHRRPIRESLAAPDAR